jgi:hypothetical protein
MVTNTQLYPSRALILAVDERMASKPEQFVAVAGPGQS